MPTEPTDTQLQGETLEPKPILLDRNDVLDALALFCSEYDSLGERFKKRLRIAIRAIPPSRAAVAAPQEDALLSAMWEALKNECCKSPSEAKTIVFLGEDKFRRALSSFAANQAGEVSAAPVFKNTKEAMLYAQRQGMPTVIPAAPPASPSDAARRAADEICAYFGDTELAMGGHVNANGVAAIISKHFPAAVPVGQDSSAAWRRWFDRLGDKASAEIVNATADLVTDERLTALVSCGILPAAAPLAAPVSQVPLCSKCGQPKDSLPHDKTYGFSDHEFSAAAPADNDAEGGG